MSLTDSEQQQLREIERRLASESPGLARLLAPGPARRPGTPPGEWWWTARVVTGVVGMVLVILALRFNIMSLAAAGAIVVATCLLGNQVRMLLTSHRWPRLR